MSFGAPWWLVLCLPWIVVEWRLLARPAAAIALPRHGLARAIAPSWRRRLASMPRWLVRAAVVLALLALARPRVAIGEDVESRSGVDLMLVLDVSSTMRSQGSFDAPRFEVVRDVVERFVAERSDDRIGLLTFARFARWVCPLTDDHRALAQRLRSVTPVAENSAEDRTAIGVALATVVTRLRTDDGRTKVVVLLSDGQNNVNDVDPVDAAEFAKAHGIRVHTVLAGTGRAAARQLEAIATTTGGSAHTAADPRALSRVYEEIDAIESRVSDVRRYPVFVEATRACAAIACVLLALALALDVLWLRRTP
ncbi:MAG: VWA domain-containing protein [Planctomycetes bacterium]|nr:VWA domain-containing protein [Planctomycetota bacterium]